MIKKIGRVFFHVLFLSIIGIQLLALMGVI